MFVGHRNLKELFFGFSCYQFLQEKEYCLTGFEMFHYAPKPYHKHILYIVDDYRILDKADGLAEISLLVLIQDTGVMLSLPESCQEANVTVLHQAEQSDVIRVLRDYFHILSGRGFLADSVLEFLYHDNGIQDMVDDFSVAYNNPVFVFDAGMNLIAANWDMALEHEGSRKMVEDMRVSDLEYKLIQQYNPTHQDIMKSENPVIVMHPEFGFRQMVCPIDHKKNMGFLVINEATRVFHKMDEYLVRILREGIYQKIRLDEFRHINRGHPYEYFIRDLLNQKVVASEEMISRFRYLQDGFSTNMYCLVIESAKSTSSVNLFHIRNDFESVFANTKTVLYNGEIVVIFCLPEGKEISNEKYEEITELCRRNSVYAGISNQFSALSQLFDYYKQAVRAIEVGIENKEEPGLSIYNHYYREHMAKVFFQNEKFEVFCHPKMKILIRHDEEHKSNLAYTLYMYLLNERNYVSTAKGLFIHRNTLLYRLKKIEQIISVSYDDPDERLYMIQSYEFFKIGKELRSC